ncbi:lactadherin-like [Mya arenaria]|nr:lactadherin-like [Mya arenaria]
MNRNQSKVNVKCDWKMLDGRSTYTTTCEAGTWSENHRCFDVSTCSNYIGALVRDSALTSSSAHKDCPPENSRLGTQQRQNTINGSAGAWCAGEVDQSPYIQVKLNAPSFVRGIATQGRDNNGQHYRQYVTQYQVLFSDNCVDFQYVMDETNEPVTFDGNNETDTVVIRMFYQMVRARCVRIFPQAHFGYVSLRFDIIGCTDWKVVFIGTPGHGGLVDVCLTTGVNTTSDLSCFYEGNERNCPQHYRNPLVDQWSKLRVAMVKYALYKKGNQVAFVIFNATDSNVTNWFQAERILNTSWTGFNKTADFIDWFQIDLADKMMIYIAIEE